MAKIEDLTLTGCSGLNFTFEVFPKGTVFRPIGAVYLITKRHPNGQHTIIYLGITEDLSTRFNNHHKQGCFDRHGANCISVRQCNSEHERRQIEKDLLCNYNFPCNEVLN